MPLILCIETATESCSTAIGDEGGVIILRTETGKNLHASRLNVLIQEMLKEKGLKAKNLSAVCVSKGPGSYTGLRIGASAAKGMAYALDIPLISLNTLHAMAFGAKQQTNFKGIYCPMIDARRMEVYHCLLDNELKEVQPTTAAVVDERFLQDLPEEKELLFFGNGMPKCKELLSQNPNARFLESLIPEAAYQLTHALDAFKKKSFENVYTFEPFYLKDFVITQSKKNPLSTSSNSNEQI